MPVLYVIGVIALIAIDQIVKHLVVASLALGDSFSVINGILSITRINNTGAAWSILSGHQFIFVIIAILAAILVTYFIVRYWSNMPYRIGLGLLLAGTLGNVIDRVMNNHVVDMFQLDFINFPIFNCADMYLTFGILILAIAIIRES